MQTNPSLTPDDLKALNRFDGLIDQLNFEHAEKELCDLIIDYDRINDTQLLLKLDKLSGRIAVGKTGALVGECTDKYKTLGCYLTKYISVVFVSADASTIILELLPIDDYWLWNRQEKTVEDKKQAIDRLMKVMDQAKKFRVDRTLEEINTSRTNHNLKFGGTPLPLLEYTWQEAGRTKYYEDEPRRSAH